MFVVNCKRLKQTCSNKQTIAHHTIIHTLESVEFMMMISIFVVFVHAVRAEQLLIDEHQEMVGGWPENLANSVAQGTFNPYTLW